jgi:hypothetical protein
MRHRKQLPLQQFLQWLSLGIKLYILKFFYFGVIRKNAFLRLILLYKVILFQLPYLYRP